MPLGVLSDLLMRAAAGHWQKELLSPKIRNSPWELWLACGQWEPPVGAAERVPGWGVPPVVRNTMGFYRRVNMVHLPKYFLVRRKPFSIRWPVGDPAAQGGSSIWLELSPGLQIPGRRMSQRKRVTLVLGTSPDELEKISIIQQVFQYLCC